MKHPRRNRLLQAVIALVLSLLIAAPAALADSGGFRPIRAVDNSDLLSFTYMPSGSWWGGQTHVHTAPHTPYGPSELAEIYSGLGQSFAFLTDHDSVTPTPEVDGFTLISGVEVSINRQGRGAHITALGVDRAPQWNGRTHVDVLNNIDGQGGLAILAHPGWRCSTCTTPSWTMAEVAALAPAQGLEVHTYAAHAVPRQGSSGWAMDHWFAALSSGRWMWGLATDDAHRGNEYGHAYIVVQAPTREPSDIIDGIRNGRFVGVATPTAGPPSVWPQEIRIQGATLTVRSLPERPATMITVQDATGEVVGETKADRFSYTALGHERFLVVTMTGSDGAKVWFQPVRVDLTASETMEPAEGGGPIDREPTMLRPTESPGIEILLLPLAVLIVMLPVLLRRRRQA